jgi:hypothetical protein
MTDAGHRRIGGARRGSREGRAGAGAPKSRGGRRRLSGPARADRPPAGAVHACLLPRRRVGGAPRPRRDGKGPRPRFRPTPDPPSSPAPGRARARRRRAPCPTPPAK